MSSVLGYELPWLEQRNGVHTAQEISHQPQLWRALSTILEEQYEAIRDFLMPLLEQPDLRIILTGAGTSAFVGDAAAPFIQEGLRFQVESIPTTDLVSNPETVSGPESSDVGRFLRPLW